jgi:hypothetical protein
MSVDGADRRLVYPSLARTATPTAYSQADGNQGRLGGHFVLNVTAIGAAPSVVFNIEGFDEASGLWYPLLISAAVVATTAVPTVFRLYPGVTPAANLSVSDFLPSTWRIRPVHGNSDSITYSLGAILRG